jgi:diguanylate cyclase (GGDEF)-like protein
VSDSNIDAIQPMPDGRIWLGLDNNGVDILDPAGLRVAALRPDPTRPESALPKDYVNTFATSATGEVYLGTEQGLYRTDRAAHSVARIPVPRRDPSAPVWTLLRDESMLWIGGFDGLWGIDPGAGGTNSVVHPGTADGLTDQRVTVIARGEQGFLWIGTKNGLNRFDLASHAIERILPDPADPQSLPAGYITSLLTDRHGRLWVGTLGAGISVLQSRDARGRPRFRRIGSPDGLVNDFPNKLLEDREGNIWSSTDDGLAVIDPATFATHTFGRAEGVPISSYWVGAGAATPEGELLFGGVGGLTVVRPDRLSHWSYRPPVVVTDVRIGGKVIPAARFNGSGSSEPLIVTPDANSIAVEFSALDYSAPERNRYAYRLGGFDADWVEIEPTRRLAAYTNVPPGEYVLQLRGSNRDGAWSGTALSVPIRVLPAWYQTMAFRVAAALVALAVLATLIQGRTAFLNSRRRELEQQVIERTAELRESQRRLEQMAYFDTLTALPNRRMFIEDLRKLLADTRRQGGRFALLLVDLDRFKQVNDTLGHDAGDALLIEAASRLKAAVRKSDCIARLGGDEFAILLVQNPDSTDVEHVCRRITEGFESAVLLDRATVKTSTSIGVAMFPDHGTTQDSLYKSADLALYDAKRTGRNTWRWYRPEMEEGTLNIQLTQLLAHEPRRT